MTCSIFYGVVLFKLIGFITGYYLFGLFGGIIGLMLGSAIDRTRLYGFGGVNPLHNALRQAVFLETVFISMGKLAKADGHVSQHEIDHVEQFMLKLNMTEMHRQQAIKLFKQGADPSFDIVPTYHRFMSVCGHTRNLKEVLLAYLIVLAMADGHFHPAEEALLIEIAGYLGYGPAEFRQMIEMVLNQTHFASGHVNEATTLDDAYKALGVSKDSSDAEIKRAYRKLMSQYHPDKLIGQGVPEDMVAMATEQAKEIQIAYDLIERNRALIKERKGI
jgi:DnaJ like chaperone protein